MRWMAIALLVVTVAVTVTFLLSINSSYDRITGRSRVVNLPQGDVEYLEGGAGLPVLVIHGSGGGFDQGELIASAVLGDGFRWIAPSRFGYLRSTFRQGSTFDDQAHAYAGLLDHLGIRRVSVVALSHGGPSALLFAAMYPDRVDSLVLISCGVSSSVEPGQAQANRMGSTLTTIFQHDLLYWGISKGLKGTLMKLMGATESVIEGLNPAQLKLVNQVIDEMNPVKPRAAGVVFDNRAAMPNESIAAIRTPTLILHARDDTLQLFRNAEFAASSIPRARLVPFDQGGHLVIAVEQSAIRSESQNFIRAQSRH